MKKAAARNAFEPESDEHFAYIAGYTAGGFPYGVTWEEMREMERAETQIAANPQSGPVLEFRSQSVARFFARYGIVVEAELQNGGLSVSTLLDRTPLVRLVPVGKKRDVVEILWWSHRERWEEIGDFGGVEMPLCEALKYVVNDEPGCFGCSIF